MAFWCYFFYASQSILNLNWVSPYFHKEMAIFLVTVIMPFTYYPLSAWQMTEAENMFVELYGRKNWVCSSDGWQEGQKEEGRPRKGQRRSPRKLWLTSILPVFQNHIKYHLEWQRKNKSKHQVLPRLRINKYHTSSLAGKALNKCLPNFCVFQLWMKVDFLFIKNNNRIVILLKILPS